MPMKPTKTRYIPIWNIWRNSKRPGFLPVGTERKRMTQVCVLAEFWNPVLPFLTELECGRLRMCGDKNLTRVLLSRKRLVFCSQEKRVFKVWPTAMLQAMPSLSYLEIILPTARFFTDRASKAPPVGYEARNLPSTLEVIKFDFFGSTAPFVRDLKDDHAAKVAALDVFLPNLKTLCLLSNAQTMLWTIPSSVTHFEDRSLLSQRLGALPPNITYLDAHTTNLQGPSEYKWPSTLISLFVPKNAPFASFANLPNLTRLHTHYRMPVEAIPPSLTSLACMTVANIENGIPPSLTELYLCLWPDAALINALPPSITILGRKVEPFHSRLEDVIPISLWPSLPPRLVATRLFMHDKPPKEFFSLLPSSLTRLEIPHARLGIEHWKLLPTNLVHAALPYFNATNARYVSRLTGLRTLALYGGLVTARLISKKFPPGITSLKLIGVGIDTRTQSRYRKDFKFTAEDSLKMDLSAFQNTLPPSLTKLEIYHAKNHEYYYTHAREIYSALPTSLETLILGYNVTKSSTYVSSRGTRGLFVECPHLDVQSQLFGCSRENGGCQAQRDNDVFTRLQKLKHLFFVSPVESKIFGPFPPLPQSLTCLRYHGAIRIGKIDAEKLPKSLNYFQSGATSDWPLVVLPYTCCPGAIMNIKTLGK